MLWSTFHSVLKSCALLELEGLDFVDEPGDDVAGLGGASSSMSIAGVGSAMRMIRAASAAN
jgi:hypothetical protein